MLQVLECENELLPHVLHESKLNICWSDKTRHLMTLPWGCGNDPGHIFCRFMDKTIHQFDQKNRPSSELLNAEWSSQRPHLAVAADPDCGQQSGDGGDDPAHCHRYTRVSQAKFAVEPQSVSDGVPALQCDGR